MKKAKDFEKNVLLINPPSSNIYSQAKLRVAMEGGYFPSLSLATLAAPLVNSAVNVKILDLSDSYSPNKELADCLGAFLPDIVGVTFTTPLFKNAAQISNIVKQFDKSILTIGGGPHASALPEDCLENSGFDAVVMGEGDVVFRDIVLGKSMHSLKGVYYRHNGKIFGEYYRNSICDLDALDYPAWNLFDIKKYRPSHLLCKTHPAGLIETSRGCIFGCEYCNKTVFGRSFRAKSPGRVVDEMEYMLRCGFKDILIADDGFTTDLPRAKKICSLIKEKNMHFYWNLSNGIRVDRLDADFLKKARDCGCYSITIGVESGDQRILDGIKKGITLDQVKMAVKLIKDAGIDVLAYFMLGLPGETKETMQKTIDFAKELEPDTTKASITLPLPGTPLFQELDRGGFIKSKDWSLYNQHDPRLVYTHPTLEWETIYEYYDKFHREFYLRGSYVLKRLKKSVVRGTLLNDAYAALKTRW